MDKTYRKALEALYGMGEAPTTEEVRAALAKRENSIEGKEADEQAKLVAWLRKRNILVAHFANGGKRNKFEAYRLKLMGVSPGMLDLIIPMPSKQWGALFIEMKRKSGGTTSSAQLWWIKQLREQGYAAEICAGFEEAKKVVMGYFDLKE